MSESTGVCARCGGAFDGSGFCPSCGAGRPEPPEYLLGSATADWLATAVVGLLPLALAAAGLLLWRKERLWTAALIYAGLGLFVLEVVAFFARLGRFRVVRQALATVWCLYTLPAALMTGCMALVNPSSAFPLLLSAVLLLAFQAVALWTAFRRR